MRSFFSGLCVPLRSWGALPGSPRLPLHRAASDDQGRWVEAIICISDFKGFHSKVAHVTDIHRSPPTVNPPYPGKHVIRPHSGKRRIGVLLTTSGHPSNTSNELTLKYNEIRSHFDLNLEWGLLSKWVKSVRLWVCSLLQRRNCLNDFKC